jgi:hypothetical protein
MKNILLLICACLAQRCLAQRTYNFTEGELVGISSHAGIIVTSPAGYNRLHLHISIDDGHVAYHKQNTPITERQLDSILKDAGTILPDNILPIDDDNLKKTAFKQVTDNRNEIVRWANADFFASFRLEKQDGKIVEQYNSTSTYYTLKIGATQVLMLKEGLIVNTKTGLHYLCTDTYKIFSSTRGRRRFTEQDILNFNFEDKFYTPYSVGGRKGLRNCFNEQVIPPVYDSIVLSNLFITCHHGKHLDLYNHMLNKLDLPGLRAWIPPKNYCIQEVNILQGNTPKKIIVTGEKLKKGRGYILSDELPQAGMDEFFGKVIQEGETFYIIPEQPEQYGEKRILYNTDNMVAILNDDTDGFPLYFSYDMPPFYCKMKDGTYSVRSIRDLIDDGFDVNANAVSEHLDAVSYCRDRDVYVLMEKNGLKGFYEISKELRYKTLKPFSDGFARFSLPDGRKGWLDSNGNEYFDE